MGRLFFFILVTCLALEEQKLKESSTPCKAWDVVPSFARSFCSNPVGRKIPNPGGLQITAKIFYLPMPLFF
jgi:hypothetical protein